MTNYDLVKRVLVRHSSESCKLDSNAIYGFVVEVKPGLNIETLRRNLRNLAESRNSGVYREQCVGSQGIFYVYWYSKV